MEIFPSFNSKIASCSSNIVQVVKANKQKKFQHLYNDGVSFFIVIKPRIAGPPIPALPL